MKRSSCDNRDARYDKRGAKLQSPGQADGERIERNQVQTDTGPEYDQLKLRELVGANSLDDKTPRQISDQQDAGGAGDERQSIENREVSPISVAPRMNDLVGQQKQADDKLPLGIGHHKED
jgi:hypothetical protein